MSSESTTPVVSLVGVTVGLVVLLVGTGLGGEMVLQAIGGTIVLLSIGLLVVFLTRLETPAG